ncbi:MAG: polysaccharide biosynthesis/export family protein [Bacteroidetes bacterium]|nr:polysaccharide biosynthesis/export family protein [Bacteroidota bacterium]
MNKPFSIFISFALIITIFSACDTYKNIPYFKDVPDSSVMLVKTPQFKEPVIQPDDIMVITIQTIDPEANALLNKTGTSTAALNGSSGLGPSQPAITGYRVDKLGNIELPFAGMVHLAGLTTFDARDTIANIISKFYKNPTVDVRFANYKVTVLGEVTRPATYIVPNERITIFDALGLAGDLTIYGKRENVLLMRDTLGEKKLIRLNLNSKDIISSPYFYIKQNDVVYVEPNKAKLATLDAYKTRLYAIIASALTVAIVLARTLR